MRRSPRHTSEVHRLARLSGELNVLKEMAEPLQQAAEHYRPIRRERRKLRASAFALVGSILAVVFTFAWLLTPVAETQQALATAIGEYLEYELPDGSMIALNTNSRILVAYTNDLREVQLRSGEALFTVVKNARRPFVVFAGTQRVEAIGTAFLVRLQDSAVEVSVTQGTVRVSDVRQMRSTGNRSNDAPSKQPEPILLETGQRVTVQLLAFLDEVEIQSVSEVELQRKLAWREGLLDFHSTPLREVVAEVNRYTGTTIVIGDPALAAKEFHGLFRVGETKLLLEALNARFNIRVTYLDAKTVVLSRGESN